MKDDSLNIKTASKRKSDHLELAQKSRVNPDSRDGRFLYEPMLGTVSDVDLSTTFLDTVFDAPIWVSSMTGGTKYASKINKNLARLCRDFNLGMGLGSCRQLLDSREHLEDFSVRKDIGDRPLYTNLGIAQVEKLVKDKQFDKISELQNVLEADGLIIHINPLQEFTQPEGDIIHHKPIDTVKELLEKLDINVIVKEVGQGFGYQSLVELMKLPLKAIEFGAYGGTNFAKLELFRNDEKYVEQYSDLINIGHTADEMVDFVNAIRSSEMEINTHDIIVSGGIKNFLDGYYFIEKLQTNAIYGMASVFLKYATGDYEELKGYMSKHIEGLKLSKTFLKIKNNVSR